MATSFSQAQLIANELLRSALSPYGPDVCGTVAAAPHAWDDDAMRLVPLTDGQRLRVAHDEREAPYVVNGAGEEESALLLSLTDEDIMALCVWARMKPGSPVAGIGVDLASLEDFDGTRGARFNHLIFPEHEQRAAERLCPERPALGYAYLFSAKEAAFKACAAPLRTWYRAHSEELLFSVLNFELGSDDRHEVGTARHAEAQAAMNAMGIRAIELHRTQIDDMALTIGLALT